MRLNKNFFMIASFSLIGGFELLSQVDYSWTRQVGGSTHEEASQAHVDASGNIYIGGVFNDTKDFDPGSGVFNMSSPGGPMHNVFLMKLDAAGNFLWAKQYGGTGTEMLYSMNFDPAGNIFITGMLGDVGDFDPGPGTFMLGGGGHFVAKLDPAGDLIWAKAIGSSGAATDLDFDASGYIYITGIHSGTGDFDPGPGTHMLTSSAFGQDMYMSKWTAAGDLIWVRLFGGPDPQWVYGLVTDSIGNMYCTGAINGTTDFDPGPGSYSLVSTGTGSDPFIMKLDSAGAFVWAGLITTSGHGEGRYITTDSDGDLFIAGYAGGTVDYDPGADSLIMNIGSTGGFFMKMDTSGAFDWAKQITGTGGNECTKIVFGTDGSLYISGSASGTGDLDPGPGTFSIATGGPSAAFVIKLDETYDFEWAVNAQGGGSAAWTMAVSTADEVYMAGSFGNIVDFDPGPGVANYFGSFNDVFVTRFVPSVSTGSMTSVSTGNTVHAYPNPAGYSTMIDMKGLVPDIIDIEIISLSGEVLYKETVEFKLQKSIDLKDISDGLYFVRISGKEYSQVTKLVVQK